MGWPYRSCYKAKDDLEPSVFLPPLVNSELAGMHHLPTGFVDSLLSHAKQDVDLGYL